MAVSWIRFMVPRNGTAMALRWCPADARGLLSTGPDQTFIPACGEMRTCDE